MGVPVTIGDYDGAPRDPHALPSDSPFSASVGRGPSAGALWWAAALILEKAVGNLLVLRGLHVLVQVKDDWHTRGNLQAGDLVVWDLLQVLDERPEAVAVGNLSRERRP